MTIDFLIKPACARKCVRLFVYVKWIHLCLCILYSRIYLCIHICMHTYIYTCKHTYMHISIRAYIQAHPRILHSISRDSLWKESKWLRFVVGPRGRPARLAGEESERCVPSEASGGASRGLGVLRRPRAVIFLSRDASKFSSPLSQRTVTGTPAPDHPGAN